MAASESCMHVCVWAVIASGDSVCPTWFLICNKNDWTPRDVPPVTPQIKSDIQVSHNHWLFAFDLTSWQWLTPSSHLWADSQRRSPAGKHPLSQLPSPGHPQPRGSISTRATYGVDYSVSPAVAPRGRDFLHEVNDLSTPRSMSSDRITR